VSNPYPPDPQQPYSPPPGIPYNQPHYEMMPPPAPKSIMVLGIIGIVLASLSLLCRTINLVVYAAMPDVREMPTATWEIIISIVSVAFAIVLLIAAIGVIRRAPWARTLILGWAAAYILLLIVELAVAIMYSVPATIEAQKNQPNATIQPGFEGFAYCGATGAILLFLIYPIFVLVFMRKANVIAAFEGAAGPISPYMQQ
jgi:hypothetical protein